MRRFNLAVLEAAVALALGLTAVPAQAHTGRPPGLENCTAAGCHFDVPPGTYDVKVLLGGDAESHTEISGETRRALLPETAVAAA